MSSDREPADAREISLKVEFASCPVQASLGVLGRKWAFAVLRNIELFRAQRFNEMIRVTPGLTKRVLAMRLRELEREGFIVRAERGRNHSKWELTEKGRDVLPVLMTLVSFGSKWYADRVFFDRKPRTLDAIFEESYIRSTLGLTRPRRSRPSVVAGEAASRRADSAATA